MGGDHSMAARSNVACEHADHNLNLTKAAAAVDPVLCDQGQPINR